MTSTPTSHPLNGGYALPKMENHPKPPPRPSISSKTASTQTSKSSHSSDALIELQVSQRYQQGSTDRLFLVRGSPDMRSHWSHLMAR